MTFIDFLQFTLKTLMQYNSPLARVFLAIMLFLFWSYLVYLKHKNKKLFTIKDYAIESKAVTFFSLFL